MPHVRERQPEPDEPTTPRPGDRPAPSSDRVDAGAATTGTSAGSHGEAPSNDQPDEDSTLEGGSPA